MHMSRKILWGLKQRLESRNTRWIMIWHFWALFTLQCQKLFKLKDTASELSFPWLPWTKQLIHSLLTPATCRYDGLLNFSRYFQVSILEEIQRSPTGREIYNSIMKHNQSVIWSPRRWRPIRHKLRTKF